jgi:hypothetical protein
MSSVENVEPSAAKYTVPQAESAQNACGAAVIRLSAASVTSALTVASSTGLPAVPLSGHSIAAFAPGRCSEAQQVGESSTA